MEVLAFVKESSGFLDKIFTTELRLGDNKPKKDANLSRFSLA